MAPPGATAAASASDQAATQPTAAAAAAAMDQRAIVSSSFRHVRTLSDDEEYLVAGAADSDSSADTDELMGRVDWSLAANSDDEHDVPPGWVQHGDTQRAARQGMSV